MNPYLHPSIEAAKAALDEAKNELVDTIDRVQYICSHDKVAEKVSSQGAWKVDRLCMVCLFQQDGMNSFDLNNSPLNNEFVKRVQNFQELLRR